jgi:hypothetical protein
MSPFFSRLQGCLLARVADRLFFRTGPVRRSVLHLWTGPDRFGPILTLRTHSVRRVCVLGTYMVYVLVYVGTYMLYVSDVPCTSRC